MKNWQKEFQEFYLFYPRKINSSAAHKAFIEQMEAGVDPLMLIDRAKSFTRNVDPMHMEWVPHPATWLRDRRWEDSDLLTDQHTATLEWFRQKWREANAAEVASRYGLIYNHPPVPEELDKSSLEAWAKDQRRLWITRVKGYVVDGQPPPE